MKRIIGVVAQALFVVAVWMALIAFAAISGAAAMLFLDKMDAGFQHSVCIGRQP